MSSNDAPALRYLAFAEQEAAKIVGLEGTAPAPIASVGIIGAGTMGARIAIAFADAGLHVTLVDRDEAAVQGGIKRIRDIYERMSSTGRIGRGEANVRAKRISPATGLDSVAKCDLVIEAVFEDMNLKTAIFRELDRIASESSVLASNTSYLNLDRIAASTRRPDRVVGLHFFNPANVTKLLEIVRGRETSAATLATAMEIAKTLKKLLVVARVGEGFIGNRIYAAYRRQCEFMLEEGSYPEEVDAALEAFGFAMGPFAVSDSSGLDIAWSMRKRLAATRDPLDRYVEIPDRLCEQGRLGRKTGAGWYRYAPGARKGEPDPEVRALIDAASLTKGITRRKFSAEDIQRRVLVTMINEAALLLAESIAARPSDIDVVMVHGYGFPKQEGGPLFWAAQQDRNWLIAELDAVAAASGHGFREGDIVSTLDRLETTKGS